MRRLPYLILTIFLWAVPAIAGTIELQEEGSILDYPYSLNFVGCGTATVTDSIGKIDLSACGGGSTNTFGTIDAPAGTDPVADSATDTLTMTSTGGTLTITGNSGTDTLNFEAVDVTCTDCLNATEIEDIYVLNTTDSMSGALTVGGLVTANANLNIANGSTTAGTLKLLEDTDNGTNYTTFKVGAQSGNIDYTLPTADAAGVLTSDGAGGLSWVAAGAGDITAVGNVTSGAAFTGTQGTTFTFLKETAGTIKQGDTTTVDTNGAQLSITGAAGNGTGNGGNIIITAGAKGASGSYGTIDLLTDSTGIGEIAVGPTSTFLSTDSTNVFIDLTSIGMEFWSEPGAVHFDSGVTSDGSYSFRILNEDNDAASDTRILELAHRDVADANVIYLKCIGDDDGTPTTDCLLAQTATAGGAVFNLGATGVSLTTDGDGALTLKSISAGSQEDLTLNLDDTSNTGVFSSSTGLTNLTYTSIGSTWGALVTASANLTIGNGATTAGVLTLLEDTDAGSNFASFQVPALSANTVYTLPSDDGDSGEQLQTDGSGNLSWEAAGSGSGDDLDIEYNFPASACEPLEAADSIPPLTKTTGTNIDEFSRSFDAATDEGCKVTFTVPNDVASGTVTFNIYWWSASATTNAVVWNVRYTSTGADSEAWDASLSTLTATCTVDGTVKEFDVCALTETVANLGWAAGDRITLMWYRDANNASDNMAGDAEGAMLSVRIPAS